jgi:hypothetical protein
MKMYNILLNLVKEYDTLIHRPSIDVINKHFNSQALRGVEVGVSFGKHAKMLLKNTNINCLYLVDPYKNYEGIDSTWDHNNMFDKAKHRLNGFKDLSKWVLMCSDNASVLFDEGSLDFVYIDGNHDYSYVSKDVALWYSKVRSGGLLMGHDFQDPNVARAVTERLSVDIHTVGYPVTWWVVKE